MNYKGILLVCLGVLAITFDLAGQQNRTLYLQHDVPQSSFLNPAVPLACGWTIGIPVLSSIHSNYGNNFIAFNQLFTNSGNGVYTSDIAGAEKLLKGNNIVSAEAHVELFGLGYRYKEWSFMATAIEKSNTLTNVPRDVFALALHGNSQFEGQRVSLNRTSAFGSWYTELGFSVAKEVVDGISWGIRGKLLFGKANVSTAKTKVGLNTNANTYDLAIDGSVDIRTSMPVWVEIENNRVGDVITDDSATPLSLFTEFGNPGLAFDVGIITKTAENIELSVSLIDVGFISWRKNLHSYTAGGDFLYTGPFNNSTNSDTYFSELGDAILDSLNIADNQDTYITALPAKLAAGIRYTLSDNFELGGVADVQAYRTKLVTGLQLNATYEVFNNIKGIASWSYQYNTFKNLGAGIIIGKHPVQLYAISDNVLGFFQPLDARNINLRFGINIMPGCMQSDEKTESRRMSSSRKGPLPGNCGWERTPTNRKRR
jgi:hypothetical protein